MKTLLISTIILFVGIVSTANAQRTTLPIDPKASKLTWTGYAEVGSYAPTGSIQLQKGQLTLVKDQTVGGTFVIDMTTLQHENGQLQGHLREDTFFDVARFPTATFVLTRLVGTTATGQLTIRGVTKPVSFPVVIRPETNGLRVTGQAVIDRTVFGIRYNSTSFFANLGDQAIKNTFALTFDLVARPVLPGQ
jgi:polyisoprenoid-binding protein YceI